MSKMKRFAEQVSVEMGLGGEITDAVMDEADRRLERPSHTPGPWSRSGDLIVGPPQPYPNPKAQPMGRVVCKLGWDFDGDCGATEPDLPWSIAASNARLIAAAPELLEACRTAFANLRNAYASEHVVIRKLTAAIAKAEGAPSV